MREIDFMEIGGFQVGQAEDEGEDVVDVFAEPAPGKAHAAAEDGYAYIHTVDG